MWVNILTKPVTLPIRTPFLVSEFVIPNVWCAQKFNNENNPQPLLLNRIMPGIDIAVPRPCPRTKPGLTQGRISKSPGIGLAADLMARDENVVLR